MFWVLFFLFVCLGFFLPVDYLILCKSVFFKDSKGRKKNTCKQEILFTEKNKKEK